MNERDEFLRDRLQPGQPRYPCCTPARSCAQRSSYRAPGLSASPSKTRPAASAGPAAAAPAGASPSPAAIPPVAPQQQAAPPAAPSATVPPPGSRTDVPVAPVPTSATELPDRGWRRILRLITFGLVKLGPSAAQRQEAQFEAAIRTGLRGNYKVGVLGKGGVGKTSVAASVGSLFAELRRQDHVVAIDADTAFGRLEQPNRPAVDRLVLGTDFGQEPAILHRCGCAGRP